MKKSSTQEEKQRSRAKAAVQKRPGDFRALAASVNAQVPEPPAPDLPPRRDAQGSVPDSTEERCLSGAIAKQSALVIIVDERHLIVTVNTAVETMFGYRLAELMGKPVSMLIAERDRQQFEERIQSHARR